jgi:hypothetical protein
MKAVAIASGVMLVGLMVIIGAGMMFKNQTNGMINVLGALAGAFIAAGIARQFFTQSGWNPWAGGAAILAGMAVGAVVMRIGKSFGEQMSASNLGNTSDYESYASQMPMADTGYASITVADSGFSSKGRHFPVMVEPGESIVSKTQTMLGGGGITLNIGGDIVTSDADDFAERIAVALPEALRRHNDIGGI